MPILISALKRMRSNKKRNVRNQSIISDIKTRIKKFNLLISQKKLDEVNSHLKILISKIGKAASKGVFHKNKASRLISRLSKKVAQLGATQPRKR